MTTMNRRSFLEHGALTAAAFNMLQASAFSAQADGEKIKLGLIGCGWWGMVDLEAAFKVGGVEVLALCDVDSANLEKSAAKVEQLQGSRPKTFKKYEELLQVEGLQAVIIATPPHWHALQLIAALERGLDVYCEKPLAYDIREGEAMVAAAEKSGRIVQVGFQRRQSPAVRQARDYIQGGSAGRIVQVDAQIHYAAEPRDGTAQDPPASLDWDLWCGPAPKLPYSPNVGHFAWRLEKEYGHGHLVDWGIHLIDATRWILGESSPKSVEAFGGIYHFKDKITTPDVLTANFEFETCPVTWRHRMYGAAEYMPEVSNGIFFYGEKETVFVADDRWVVVPKGRNATHKVNQARGDMSPAHMAAFLTAVRTRKEPEPLVTPADAHLSTSAVQLAMIAYETGGKVTWDAATGEIAGNPAAAGLLKREYRAPWKHPHGG
jgi:predicted dehydrogenase